MNNAILIFSGYNQRANLAFCRTAEKYNIPFIIIANGHRDTIFHTQYQKKVKAIRPASVLNISHIGDIIKKLNNELNIKRLTILPNTEFLNRFILKYRRELAEINCVVPLVPQDLYKGISDKYDFGRMSQEFGLAVPQEVGEIDIPFVAKPIKNFSDSGRALKPYLILNEKDYETWRGEETPFDFYFQKYISGQSYYLLYYLFKNGEKNPIRFSQKNLIQQHSGKSIVAAISSQLHLNDICKKFEDLLISTGFYGLVMIEVKYFEGIYYMIEANPRLWGPSQLFIDGGAPLFEGFLLDNGFDVELPEQKCSVEARYFWFGGFMETLQQKKKLAFHQYSQETFEEEFNRFFDVDVYKRSDSINLYINELCGLK